MQSVLRCLFSTVQMEIILDQNFFQEAVLFCLHFKLVRGFWGEKPKVIQALVELRSLDIQRDGLLMGAQSLVTTLFPLCHSLSIFRVLAKNACPSPTRTGEKRVRLDRGLRKRVKWGGTSALSALGGRASKAPSGTLHLG